MNDDFVGKRRKRARGEDKFEKKEGKTTLKTTDKDGRLYTSDAADEEDSVKLGGRRNSEEKNKDTT